MSLANFERLFDRLAPSFLLFLGAVAAVATRLGALQRMLERTRGARPSDDERHHHVREDDHVAKRDDRQGLVDFEGVFHGDSESLNANC